MDKTEKLKQEFVGKYWPIQLLNSLPDNVKGAQMEDDLDELLEQYAQRVSIEFTLDYLQVEKELIEPEFNEWKSNQEEGNVKP